MKVLNFGSMNIDYVYNVAHILVGGETLSATEMNVFAGGKGLNQSIALAKAGVPVRHAGLVGAEGEVLLAALNEAGVDTGYIRQGRGKSGHTMIQVDAAGQNCILLYGGTNQQLTRDYIDEVLGHFENGDILLLQNEVNELPYLVSAAARRGLRIILNPSPYDQKLEAVDFSLVSIFLINEIEGAQMSGAAAPEQILARLTRQYPQAAFVLTLGSQGSVYQDCHNVFRQEIFKVKAVDTTAAGDTFTGYFIAALIAGLPVPAGLRLAAKASAIAVSRPGAAPSIPTRAEVEAGLACEQSV